MVAHGRSLAALVSLALASCDLFEPGPQVCTLIGCAGHGLVVQFDRPPSLPVRVEAYVLGDPLPVVVECPDPRQCVAGVLFPSFFPENVRIKVLYAQASTERQQRITYITTQPNGPDCAPTCRSGIIVVPLPQT
jgi:hypothetical protein